MFCSKHINTTYLKIRNILFVFWRPGRSQAGPGLAQQRPATSVFFFFSCQQKNIFGSLPGLFFHKGQQGR